MSPTEHAEVLFTESASIDIPAPKPGELAKYETPPPPAVQLTGRDDPHALLELLITTAMNPNCDLVRMERLLVMHANMEDKIFERAFNKAMGDAQKEMKAVVTDRHNEQTKSDFASGYAIDSAIRQIYTKHGFALTYKTAEIPEPDGAGAAIRIICKVSHSDGFTRDYDIPMPADGKGAKGGDVMTKTHAMGSAISYAMRYLPRMIFNIIIRDKADDDGNAADGIQLISEAQVAELTRLLAGPPQINLEKFLTLMGQSSLDMIPLKKFHNAVMIIRDATDDAAARAKEKAARK